MNKNDCRSGLLILVTAAVLASGCGRGEPGQTQRTNSSRFHWEHGCGGQCLINAVIGKVGPGTDGFRPRDQTRIKTPPLIRLFSVRQEIEESNR